MRSKLMLLILVGCSAQLSFGQLARNTDQIVPTGKGWGIALERQADNASGVSGKTVPGANGISYHGGPVMGGNVNIYFIWYGNWSNGPKASDSQVTVALLDELFGKWGGMGSSGYALSSSTYSDSSRRVVSGSFSLAQSAQDSYSAGKKLTDASVQAVVTSAIKKGKLPKDSNGLYFVLTSSDVDETSGFCKKYCGWHNHANILNADIKFSFVGNPDRCSASCEAQTESPNGDSGADGMASIMAHETGEVLTNPDLNAWYDSRGQETGDKCAWMFGPVQGTIGYGAYNQMFGNRNWLIQLNWENSRGGGCVQTKGGEFYKY